ncbi:hypothetical protein EAO18_27760 [Klebsiella pneumoniae]|nr:hypothetical protein EAO18_27760 [Klebsiella pneumoniae]
MSSSNALVKCIHQSHSEHPLIIALHHFIKSWNYLQSNNKIAKSSENCKAGCNESCKPGREAQSHTAVNIFTAARRSKRSHSVRTRRGSGKAQRLHKARTLRCRIFSGLVNLHEVDCDM